MDDELRKMFEGVKKSDLDQEMVEKYGDPTDESDPRNWAPSTRQERGLSVSDRIKLLELDTELIQMHVAKVSEIVMTRELERMKDEMTRDPEGFIKKLLGKIPAFDGPPGSSNHYAGSTESIAPDTMVETPDGVIRADQIPGYRDVPGWRPSPDWVEANCTCPVHAANRQANGGDEPYEGPTGLYL